MSLTALFLSARGAGKLSTAGPGYEMRFASNRDRIGVTSPLRGGRRLARIIIAEDDEIVGEIARDVLIADGHGVGLLTNGKDALAVIRQRKPDLVILDCNMPDLENVTPPGYADERLRRVAHRGGRLRCLAIIKTIA